MIELLEQMTFRGISAAFRFKLNPWMDPLRLYTGILCLNQAKFRNIVNLMRSLIAFGTVVLLSSHHAVGTTVPP